MAQELHQLNGILTTRFSPPAGTSESEIAKLATSVASRRQNLLGLARSRGPTLLASVENKSILLPTTVDASSDAVSPLLIELSFLFSCSTGSRFNGKHEFGALYLSLDSQTAAEEVKFHFGRRFSSNHKDFPIGEVEFQGVEAALDPDGALFDLRRPNRQALREMYLDEDISDNYQRSQAFARTLIAEGYDGIIYPSVRAERGTCIALFDLRVVRYTSLGDRLLLERNRSGNLAHRILPR